MHIAFAIDENFVQPLCATLSSFFRHHSGGPVTIHLLADRLPDAAHRRLEQFVRDRGAAYRAHAPAAAQFGDLPLAMTHVSQATFFRLLLPDLLPAVDRILYLDVDLLIRRSLEPLYTIDLHGHPVAAVSDVRPADHAARLGVDAALGYLNAGVLVMDLPAIRRERMTDRALAYLRDNRASPKRCLLADQDGINVALEGRWLRLPDTWNFFLSHCAEHPRNLAPHLLQQLLDGPAIVHYCGHKKPWMRLYALPFQQEYLSQAARDGIHFPRGWGVRDAFERISELQRMRRMRRRHRVAGLHVPGRF